MRSFFKCPTWIDCTDFMRDTIKKWNDCAASAAAAEEHFNLSEGLNMNESLFMIFWYFDSLHERFVCVKIQKKLFSRRLVFFKELRDYDTITNKDRRELLVHNNSRCYNSDYITFTYICGVWQQSTFVEQTENFLVGSELYWHHRTLISATFTRSCLHNQMLS